ncbi:5'-nucleotidase /3'-nucleotidase /exopolyphosphatase [Cohaesibacter sp. ES.047]|uniref:5'/3'-nucleotidase SurE n=1 Tax=Cohaesibacter sp. ES.047 TaxID=1798205 RepID=UPI000BB6A3A3|nr:5'/3'-nucleotidase SurE [Cohaesibacter sp. ES.047]SNY93642.1 5'-nucleotidase /3'-nucleotidase /exopolyphosphatase [Cohaesibacter sp. ES.047]
MRILLTNDDGINAPGLKVLEEIAHSLSDDVWVVAPETEQSGMSHSLTLHDPLRMRQIDEKRFAVKGTPTDCVIMGAGHALPEKPDLVLSGVNRGQNMAEDVTYSGTVAGAMEGALLGVRSIALSQAYGWESKDGISWDCAREHGARVVKDLLKHVLPFQTLLNVNFPDCDPADVKDVVLTRQGRRDQAQLSVEAREDTRGQSYFWLGFEGRRFEPQEGTDLYAIYHKQISVTPLHLDMTDRETLKKLSAL